MSTKTTQYIGPYLICKYKDDSTIGLSIREASFLHNNADKIKEITGYNNILYFVHYYNNIMYLIPHRDVFGIDTDIDYYKKPDIEITKDLIESSTNLFLRYFDEQISEFEKLCGDDNVLVKYGVLYYDS